LRTLVEGDAESESILNSMLIADNKNPSYNTEYTKFLASLTGGGSIGSTGAIGGAPAAYY